VEGGSSEAALLLMAAYFIFDVKYPLEVRPSLLFLQLRCLGKADYYTNKSTTLANFMSNLAKIALSDSESEVESDVELDDELDVESDVKSD